MLNQLRLKFVAVVMLVSTFLVTSLLGLLYFATAANLEAENIRMMQSINELSEPDGFTPEEATPDGRLHYFILSKDKNDELLVVDNTGFDLTDTAMTNKLYRIASQDENSEGELKSYALRYYRMYGSNTEYFIFSDISDELAILKRLRINCAIICILSLCLIGVIIQYLSRVMFHPVETAWEQQKQFIADASHELKTPLTVIMTNTEMLRSPEYSSSKKEEMVTHIEGMTSRMRSLVEGMLILARLDSGAVKLNFAKINYADLIEQSLLPFEPVFFESGRLLESRLTAGIELMGSERHLAQVTDILLDNALKYSEEGSTVYVTLKRQGKHALLCVDSCGTPLSPEDCTKIFLRFYTVDKARTGNSYGLGLSIAQSIVSEHNGKIWAESFAGHNKFFVRLPL